MYHIHLAVKHEMNNACMNALWSDCACYFDSEKKNDCEIWFRMTNVRVRTGFLLFQVFFVSVLFTYLIPDDKYAFVTIAGERELTRKLFFFRSLKLCFISLSTNYVNQMLICVEENDFGLEKCWLHSGMHVSSSIWNQFLSNKS